MKNKAGEVLCVALEGLTPSERELDFFNNHQPAGLTLFERNISPDTKLLAKLCAQLQALRTSHDPPMIIAIDQEGGRVDRFKRKDFPNYGPPLNLQDGGTSPQNLKEIEAYGRLIGQSLFDLGVNVNFAPVCDIDTEPTNKAIGDRCFGKTVEQAIPRARSFMQGMQAAGVLGCLKHFPGQGDARVDTHYGQAVINLSLSDLEGREFKPFQNLIDLTEMVMISHCIYPALDKKPASLSPKVIQGLLRQKFGFKGVVVSDDMNMKALSQDTGAWEQSLINAMLAGTDLLLVCRDIEKCFRAVDVIEREMKASKSFQDCIEKSTERVRAVRMKLKSNIAV